MSDTTVTAGDQRRLGLICAAIVALILFLGITAGPVDKAQAITPGTHGFCTNWWLKPFGQSGDRCAAGHDGWGKIGWVLITTHERAGCVNYEGWYGELYSNWACFPKGTSGYKMVPNDGGSYDGIIRNNNQSSGGYFDGSYWCCYGL
ncbi:MAG TPA: hypothetical protein VI039_07505 [Solirubrobacterales bacterium]